MVIRHTESFYEVDHIGGDLAYLMGAILDPSSHGAVDWKDHECVNGKPPVLLEIIREYFAPGHPIWQFIQQ